MSDSLFYHPDVLRVIRAILVSRGIREPETLKDAIGWAVVDCLEHTHETGRSPETVKEAIALVRVITDRKAVNAVLKAARRAKTDAGSTDKVDEHAAPSPWTDPVDAGKIDAALREKLTDGDLQTLLDRQAGTSHAELAAESGISVEAQRKRVQALQKRARKALLVKGFGVAGGLAAVLGAIWVIHIGPWGGHGDNVAARRPDDEHPTAAEKQIAKEQRRVAAGACEEKKWDECEKALDEAAKLDPIADRDYVAVVAMRKAIAAGRAEAGDAGSGRAGTADAASPR